MPRDQLERYRPELAEPADFDAFWHRTLSDARAMAGEPRIVPVQSELDSVDVFDVAFSGFAGHPIKAWLLRPRAGRRLPAVVEFNGYGGGRGLPHERLAWVTAGYAFLFMDTRGQGGSWGSGGETDDPVGVTPAAPGSITRGILNPSEYYYRRVFTDAVRAVDTVRAIEWVDSDRIAVAGGSQGGGIALAVSGLVADLVAVMPEVPFLCDFRRGVELSPAEAYGEIRRYLSVRREDTERVFETLAYFDGVSFAARASAPAIFSVGLMDEVCPPSTVFAAYNAYRAAKQIEVYPFNGHEGGGAYQWVRQARWLRAVLS